VLGEVSLLLRLADYLISRGQPFNSEKFVNSYNDGLRKAIDLVEGVSELKKDGLTTAATALLKILASVVQGYHRKGEVNANYMVQRDPSEDLLAKCKFAMHDRRHDSFAGFLQLEAWGKIVNGLPNPKAFVLPVENPSGPRAKELLFGAPAALIRDKPFIVGDTLKTNKITRKNHERIQREIGEYFQAQRERLRSFVSIPVGLPPSSNLASRPFGVVNIQSSRKSVLGALPGNQRKLLVALSPFVQVLSYIMLRRDGVAGTLQAGARDPEET